MSAALEQQVRQLQEQVRALTARMPIAGAPRAADERPLAARRPPVLSATDQAAAAATRRADFENFQRTAAARPIRPGINPAKTSLSDPAPQPQAFGGSGGGGLPDGYTFTEFTGCDEGTPFTYWVPIWDTNPEA